MSVDDVVRVVWRARYGEIESYTVHADAETLAIISRNPVTLSLYCHHCQRSSRQPCEHIDDVVAYIHGGP